MCLEAVAAVGDRKSKRARKGRAPIRVSADDTVHDLKLKIVQTLNVHPHNALLHLFRNNTWQPIADGDTRLAGKQTSVIKLQSGCHVMSRPEKVQLELVACV